MNAGYLFIIISWLMIILLATGWLDPLCGFKEKVISKRRKIMICCLSILLLQGLYLPFTEKVLINAGSFLLLGVILIYCLWKYALDFLLPLISVMLFLGFLYAVAYELFFLDPVLMIVSPQYLLPLCITLFVMCTVYQLPLQLLALTGSYLIGELVHKLLLSKHVHLVYLGDAMFRDQFVFALVLLIMVNGLGRSLIQFFLKLMIRTKVLK